MSRHSDLDVALQESLARQTSCAASCCCSPCVEGVASITISDPLGGESQTFIPAGMTEAQLIKRCEEHWMTTVQLRRQLSELKAENTKLLEGLTAAQTGWGNSQSKLASAERNYLPVIAERDQLRAQLEAFKVDNIKLQEQVKAAHIHQRVAEGNFDIAIRSLGAAKADNIKLQESLKLAQSDRGGTYLEVLRARDEALCQLVARKADIVKLLETISQQDVRVNELQAELGRVNQGWTKARSEVGALENNLRDCNAIIKCQDKRMEDARKSVVGIRMALGDAASQSRV